MTSIEVLLVLALFVVLGGGRRIAEELRAMLDVIRPERPNPLLNYPEPRTTFPLHSPKGKADTTTEVPAMPPPPAWWTERGPEVESLDARVQPDFNGVADDKDA